MLRFLLKAVVIMGFSVGILVGCTARDWYNSASIYAGKKECELMPPPERPGCLAKVNTQSYEDYERARNKQ